MSERNYLDNAATSWPKPDAVYAAMDDYNRNIGVAVGRSGSAVAVELSSTVERLRQNCRTFFNLRPTDKTALTFNCTDSLNTAIHGLLSAGDHVVASVAEHNSVLRPLVELSQRIGVTVDFAPLDGTRRVDIDSVARLVRPTTRLVILTHASNVTGTIQPAADVGQIAHDNDALFLLDAAQTAGHIPVDFQNLPVDILACAGHKGLMGPLGTGLLMMTADVDSAMRSHRQGGTGTTSESDQQPKESPAKLESGNHNAPGLCGLAAAFDWLDETGPDKVFAHVRTQMERLLDGLRAIAGLQNFSDDVDLNAGVVSVSVDGMDPHELATILEQAFQIESRAGLHCAPKMHAALGTLETGGTLRLSPGYFTTADQIDAAVDALRQVCGG